MKNNFEFIIWLVELKAPVIKAEQLHLPTLLSFQEARSLYKTFKLTWNSHTNFHESGKRFQQMENQPAAVRRGAVLRGRADCYWILDTDNKLITDKSNMESILGPLRGSRSRQEAQWVRVTDAPPAVLFAGGASNYEDILFIKPHQILILFKSISVISVGPFTLVAMGNQWMKRSKTGVGIECSQSFWEMF